MAGTYIEIPPASSSGSAVWGMITGTLSSQADLQAALNAKQDTLPSQIGNAGKFLTTNGTVLSWGAAGAISLVAISSNTNAVVGNIYLCDTTLGIFTLTFPASPTINDVIGVKDNGGAFNTNNLTIGRNGKSIEGLAADYVCFMNRMMSYFVYDGTQWVMI